MWMTATDIAAFPEFYNYLGRLRGVLNGWKIPKYMKKYGCLDKEAFGHALLKGTAPQIVFQDYLGGSCAAGTVAFGCFRESSPYQIGLDQQIVQDFEDDPTNITNMERAGNGLLFPRVGRIVLHELVHWGNFWCGSPTFDPVSQIWLGNGEKYEHGEAFDRAVYGKFQRASDVDFEDDTVAS